MISGRTRGQPKPCILGLASSAFGAVSFTELLDLVVVFRPCVTLQIRRWIWANGDGLAITNSLMLLASRPIVKAVAVYTPG